jgi:hypothetical protein
MPHVRGVRPRERHLHGLRSSHVVHLAPALALAVLIHAGALGTFFAQDDITFLRRATEPLFPAGPTRFLSTSVAFRLEHAAFGLDPLGYHVVNLLLHLANVAGVYFLGLRLLGGRGRAAGAAILFGASSIAFTPLHWASGIIELLSCALLIAATLTLLRLPSGAPRRWLVALLLLAAMLAKETAVAWIGCAALACWVLDRAPPQRAIGYPAIGITVAYLAWYLLGGTGLDRSPTGAYALTASPDFLLRNLSTYVAWSVALWNPIRDVSALADVHAWRVAWPAVVLFGIALAGADNSCRTPARLGVGWWLAFLLPVLPLAHHTYLYYLYIPWVGGSIAVVAAGAGVLSRLGTRRAVLAGALLLATFVAAEGRNVATRRSALRDHLPVDRTIRESTLLRRALAGIEDARLPPGTKIGFVNPTLRSPAPPDPTTGPSPRVTYIPLEAALRGGETIRLFFPGLLYVGFATTIPAGWSDVECFRYEQRGWLERWGRGEAARLRQAEVLAASR